MLATRPTLYAVNFHLLNRCNLRCKFCYSHFADITNEQLLSLEKSQTLLEQLKEAGCVKLNFAGGEPLLHPQIGPLIQYAHGLGLKTSLVTNGSCLHKVWLESFGSYLNWIGISCDSSDESVQQALGRGNGKHVESTKNAFASIKDFNSRQKKNRIHTKLNSVVTQKNWQEDMSDLVLHCGVDRWKILQALLIKGENDRFYSELAITSKQFQFFVERHRPLQQEGIAIVAEDNEAMTESYIMIDPQGCFFQNKGSIYIKSSPLYEVGVHRALEQVGFSEQKFLSRGGLYNY